MGQRIPGLLSVVLTSYNHASTIGGQITAILGQSYRHIELLVMEDCSTDQSVQVIEAAIAGDGRARLVRNERNLGVMPNNDAGRALIKGEYVYLAAADDQVLPGFFEKSMNLLTRHPQAGLSWGTMAWIDDRNATMTPMPLRLTKEACYLSPDAFVDVICGEHITGHTSIMRTAALEEAMPPREDYHRLRWVGDWFPGSVLACRHGCCHIPEPLCAIRLHGANYGNGAFQWDQQQDVVLTILRLLKSPAYRDVLPYFARGGLMAGLPFVAETVLARPELWDVTTAMLIAKPLGDWWAARTRAQQEHWKTNNPGAMRI